MMNALSKGFKQVLIHRNIVGYLFLTQFIFAGIVGFFIQQDLKENIGNTIAGHLFESDFNYTLLSDLIRTIPDAFANSGKAFLVVFIIYFILSILLHAGSIESLLYSKRQTFRQFMAYIANLFFPFIFIAVFFLILFVIVTVIVFGPLFINVLSLVEYLESDRLFFYLLYVCLCIYFLLLSFIVNWSINTRINYIVTKESIWKSLKAGGAWTRKKYITLTAYFGFFTFLAFLGIKINIALDGSNLLVLTFILSLVILFFKIFLRLWNYASLAECCSAIKENDQHFNPH